MCLGSLSGWKRRPLGRIYFYEWKHRRSKISQYGVDVRSPGNTKIALAPRYSSSHYFVINLITINFPAASHVDTKMALASESHKNTRVMWPNTRDRLSSHSRVARESFANRTQVVLECLLSCLWLALYALRAWGINTPGSKVYISWWCSLSVSLLEILARYLREGIEISIRT